MNTLLHYYINSHYKLLPNKYLELNKTKAIAGVCRLGSYSPYSYYTDAHPLYCTIIKLENYKIQISMFLIISWSLETPLYDFMTVTNNTQMNE